MVVLRDMMFIGVCIARWSPVVSARSLRCSSMLISSEDVDGMLTSAPLSAIANTSGSDRRLTCKYYKKSPKHQAWAACGQSFTNDPRTLMTEY